MGMFITKIQIDKSTSPKEYVTGEKIELRDDDSGKTYSTINNREVEVTVDSYTSLNQIKEKFLKKRA